MIKLMIDTSTQALIIILKNNDNIIDSCFEIVEKDHSSKLLPKIASLLNKNNLSVKDINELYVTEGPGSYTGVRIGVTVAKTLAYSLNIPLSKVSTLKVISASYLEKCEYILPIIDARRGNVFSGLYKVKDNNLVEVLDSKLYNFDNLLKEIQKLTDNKVLICGLDVNKFIEEISLYNQFTIANNFYDDLNAYLIMNLNYEKVLDIHNFIPNYERLPEAELNLL